MTFKNPDVQEKFDLLVGTEVNSLHYEGCVAIQQNGDVIMRGEKVDTLSTSTRVNRLWKEMLFEEGY